MGDSGSWVVQDSKLVGHVFAIQDETLWSYMVPITQVIDDIQETLLACTIELPISGGLRRGDSALLCAKASRSHHSLAIFGLSRCPICEEDLSGLIKSREGSASTHSTISGREKMLPKTFDPEGLPMEPASKASQISSPENLEESGSRTSTLLDAIPYTTRYTDDGDYSDSDLGYGKFLSASAPRSTKKNRPAARWRGEKNAMDIFAPRSIWSSSESEVTGSAHSSMNMNNPTTRESRREKAVKTSTQISAGHQEAQEFNSENFKRNIGLHIVLRRSEPWIQSLTDQTEPQIVNSLFDIDNPANPDIRTTKITLHGASIKRTIRSIVSYYPSIRLKTKLPVQISEPYAILLHHMEQLGDHLNKLRYNASRNKLGNKPTDNHIDIDTLLAFTRRISSQSYFKAEEARYRRNVCTFRMLWFLLKPGTTVYHDDNDGDYSALVIGSVDVDNSILRSPLHSIQPYTVYLWRLDFDGNLVGRSTHKCKIAPFEGTKEINKLKLFPCKFLDESDNGRTRARLEERGRRWYKLLLGGAMHYSGLLLDVPGQDHVREPPRHQNSSCAHCPYLLK